MNKKSISENSGITNERPKRDWFGYAVSGLIGLLITLGATWYQLYSTEKEASAAEIERLQSVRKSLISIVEEQALNGVKIEPVRITRLIEQRRREQKVDLPITINDVVEQAEFNIASSPHLNINTKEEIKNIFEIFYKEIAERNFEEFPKDFQNSALLNEIATYIQSGRSIEALNSLKKLSISQEENIEELKKNNKPTFIDALIAFFSDIRNTIIFFVSYIVLILIFNEVRKKLIQRRNRRLTGSIW